MSRGEKVGLSTARAIAERLVSTLRPSCERIEIAGSVRRGVPLVSDIEIVAMPRLVSTVGDDLWSTPVEVDCLVQTLHALRASGSLPLRWISVNRSDVQHRDGPAYKALSFEGMPVDLFIVRDPDAWGVIFTIRTGPADWSHRLVTDCQKYLRRVEGGHLYRSGQLWPCPTEEAFFDGIGQAWVEPAERSAGRVEIRP